MTDITLLLPHRGAMLLVDHILTMEPGVSATAVHRVADSEPCFSASGTNPKPQKTDAWPRTLLVEFVGQTAAALCATTQPGDSDEQVPLFAGASGVKFLDDAHPSDQVIAEVSIDQVSGKAFFIKGTARVDDRTLCEIDQAFVIYQPAGDKTKEKK